MLTVSDLMYTALIFLWAVMLGIVTFENKVWFLMLMWVLLTAILSSAASVKLVVKIIACSLLVIIYVEVVRRLLRMVRNIFRRLPRVNVWPVVHPYFDARNVAAAAWCIAHALPLILFCA
jgi:hypothetical protein